jgi:hypothetical protein
MNNSFDFEKLVPGFEFLKNLGQNKASSSSAIPNWVAPTMDPNELDKKIQELKTVQFWLDQNAKALGATIQALEVQKMTLSTLQGMNFNMKELAESFRSSTNAWVFNAAQNKTDTKAAQAQKNKYSFTSNDTSQSQGDEQNKPPQAHSRRANTRKTSARSRAEPKVARAAVDPAAWWNSLSEQFQDIAQKTVQDMQKHAAQNQHLHSTNSQAARKSPASVNQPKSTTPRASVKRAGVKKRVIKS